MYTLTKLSSKFEGRLHTRFAYELLNTIQTFILTNVNNAMT